MGYNLINNRELRRRKRKERPEKKVNPVTAVLDAISGCMSPIIPAIIGAGIVKVLLIVLGYFVPADNQTMQLLDVIGDAAFDFLPVLVAFSVQTRCLPLLSWQSSFTRISFHS